MTDMSSSPEVGTAVSPQSSRAVPKTVTGWVGWIVFAATMMWVIGILHAIEGLVALFKDDYYQVADTGLVISINYTAWGWVQLIVGIFVAVSGFALYRGPTWARVVAVALAVLSVMVSFAFIAAYPVWAIIIIATDVFVIYAITVHGHEMREPV